MLGTDGFLPCDLPDVCITFCVGSELILLRARFGKHRATADHGPPFWIA
jgi:hypothetical protein